MRNVDKIKSLERELGKWRKKVREEQAELKTLREDAEKADEAARELSETMDAVCTALALRYGAEKFDADAPEVHLGWNLELGEIDVAQLRADYEVHARRNGDGGYTIGVMPRASGK